MHPCQLTWEVHAAVEEDQKGRQSKMRQLIIKKQLNNFLVGGRRSLGGRVSKNRFFFEDTDARYDVCKKDVSRHVSPNKQMWLDGREAGIFTGWLINCSCFR